MSAQRHVRRRRAARAGYTLIEVMMAVAVMTAGAVGIMALHQATMRGNLDARQVATATHLAGTWIERLQRDAQGWSQGGPTAVFTPLMLAQTRYLNLVPARGTAPTWFVPGPSTATESATFDHWGRDTLIGGQMEYCTNVRLQWVYVAQAMRADVRVWWARRSPSATGGAALAQCAPGTDPNTLTNRLADVRFVYASTVIRWVPAPAAAGAGP
jgi:prepilin-type N-terminal cleavage/methylation domain-containing protein